jgi:hypothetical protein
MPALASVWPDHGDFRSTPVNGHSQDRWACLKGDDRWLSEGRPSFRAPALRQSLSAQRVQHFSSSGKIDDFVFGVECVDDGA